MRQIQMGGKDLIKAFSEQSVVAEDNDEDAVKAFFENMNSFGGTFSGGLSAIADDIIRELQLSVGYFENRHDSSVKSIYCSGGLALSKAVTEYINSETGYNLTVWNPVQSIKLADHIFTEDLEQISSQLAVCIGFAIKD